jgi:hypothetical protein
MNLSKQFQKAYDYVAAHAVCTLLDIISNTGVA